MIIPKQNSAQSLVVRSINNNDKTRCVDIFRRKDNSFGFEEYRLDPETNEGWYKIGFFEESTFFTSAIEAYDSACEIIRWLNDEKHSL